MRVLSHAASLTRQFRCPSFSRCLHQLYLKNTFTGEDEPVTIQSCNIMVGSGAPSLKRLPALAYCCGPTVYDHSHIGHALTYLKFDLFRRFLSEYTNVDLITAMNVTDVDDKIIAKASKESTDVSTIASKYLSSFLDDLQALNIAKPHIMMGVSENMEIIVRYIEQLEKSGAAYINPVTGDVVADSSSLPKYRNSLAQDPSSNLFIDQDKLLGKKLPSDFVLWKRAKPGEPKWSHLSPTLGAEIAGRPGWHVECSALINSAFGSSIQFHFGGKDLIFPHHHNESVASVLFHGKSCCHPSKQDTTSIDVTSWCQHWLHFGHIIIRGEKMSKSLGNSLYIKDFLASHDANILRLICLMVPYRTDLEFNEELLSRAREVDRTLNDFVFTLQSMIHDWQTSRKYASVNSREEFSSFLDQVENSIFQGLANDFNLPQGLQAIESLHSYLKHTQCGLKEQLCIIDLIRCKFTLEKWLKASGLDYGLASTFTCNSYEGTDRSSTEREVKLIHKMQDLRNDLRRTGVTHVKKYGDHELLKICDELRTWINEQGFVIADKSVK